MSLEFRRANLFQHRNLDFILQLHSCARWIFSVFVPCNQIQPHFQVRCQIFQLGLCRTQDMSQQWSLSTSCRWIVSFVDLSPSFQSITLWAIAHNREGFAFQQVLKHCVDLCRFLMNLFHRAYGRRAELSLDVRFPNGCFMFFSPCQRLFQLRKHRQDKTLGSDLPTQEPFVLAPKLVRLCHTSIIDQGQLLVLLQCCNNLLLRFRNRIHQRSETCLDPHLRLLLRHLVQSLDQGVLSLSTVL